MRQHSYRAGIIALLGTIALMAAGCRTITTQLSPSQIKVAIDIKDYHLGKTRVGVHFTDTSGNTVEFVHGETITCDGVYLAYDSGFFAHAFGYGAYMGDVPLQASGSTYTFTYTPAGGAAITIPVAVVNAPMRIAQPKSDAAVTIPSGAPLAVTYPPSGLANTGVYGVATDSRYHTSIGFTLDEPGSVSFKADDFHDFAPGPGNISLARVTNGSQGNSPFAEVKSSYENIQTIQITWQ